MARRLAAILAADVVGYSRLMAVDEAGTHGCLKALRRNLIEPQVAERHGRVIKLAGDGALIEFPSVVDAVECAAEMQRCITESQKDVPVIGASPFAWASTSATSSSTAKMSMATA